MRMPPLLLAASLAYWGRLTGHLPEALFMGAALEARFLIPFRWMLKPSDFHRVMDVCLLIFAGALLYLFFTPLTQSPISLILQWLPFFLLPLALAQAYGAARRIRIRDMVYFLPWKHFGPGSRSWAVDGSLIYFLVVLYSSGCANVRTPYHFLWMFLLVAWLFLPSRPRRHHILLWIAAMLAAGVIGFGTQKGIHEIQLAMMNWVRHYSGGPFKATTGLGETGELKFSSEIEFRVRSESGPILLRRASYDFFNSQDWIATNGTFTQLTRESEDTDNWLLAPRDAPPQNSRTATIYEYFPRPEELTLLPPGAWRIENLDAEQVSVNRLGAVQAGNAPGLANYHVNYAPGAFVDGPPAPTDYVVSGRERPALEQVAKELGLQDMSPAQAVLAVTKHLQTNYTYSLYLRDSIPAPGGRETPLGRFLLDTRSGHCEYFATAAAMLLRQAGIPTRYVLGYAAHEYDPDTGLYIVRRRHAHTWILAWVNGTWIDVDATPPAWTALETPKTTFRQRFSDFRSRAMFWFSRYRWLDEGRTVRRILLGSALLLGLILLYRLRGKEALERIRTRGKKNTPPAQPKPGADSDLYRVIDHLRAQNIHRPPQETLLSWLTRLDNNLLRQATLLHYRYRFDPNGLTPTQKQHLQTLVNTWLTENTIPPAPHEGG